MKKWFCSAGVVLGLLLVVTSVNGQAACTASTTTHLALGAGLLYLENDYNKVDYGLSTWADVNFNNFVGVEAEVHLGTLDSPSDFGENSYLVGPRLMYSTKNGTIYGKAMVGRGTFIYDFPGKAYSNQYNIYAFGGGLEHKINNAITWRIVDAVFQTWKSFKPRGLTPYTISSGLMWTF